MTIAGESPLVSIIISNYNYGRFLSDAIDSALGQTYQPTEVIVVDDGSTDNSRDIIGDYDERIMPILKENGGQSSAFNEGFAASRGVIVIFLDSDDMLLPDAVERVVGKWSAGIAKIQYRLQVIDAEGHPQEWFIPPAHYSMPNGDMRAYVLSRGTYITPYCSGNAYSRHMLEHIFPIKKEDHRLFIDTYLLPLAVFYGDIVSIEDTLGLYRMHGNNDWSHRTVDPNKFMKEILGERRRKAYIRKVAAEFNLKVSFTEDPSTSIQVIKKLATMLLSPSSKKTLGGSVAQVVRHGIGTVWKENEVSVVKRLGAVIFMLSCPFLPRDMATRLFRWYLYPELRPFFLRKIV